jgi:hypothetical protein
LPNDSLPKVKNGVVFSAENGWFMSRLSDKLCCLWVVLLLLLFWLVKGGGKWELAAEILKLDK